ncbi:MAG: SGNH/GDSL hydrolase family protein [Desulfitobacterium hafniense]|nr:SGNH/GDSL hydrolase family protein [Desulfitobacterium hafniense]
MRIYRLQIRLIQLSVLLTVIVLVSGFMGAWGSNQKKPDNVSNQDKIELPSGTVTIKGNTKIVALGDSFTYGYPEGPEKSWPEKLAKGLQVTVVNKGKSYQTARDLLSRFDQDVIAEQPGRVIIFIGTGDALQGVSLKDYQSNIQAMIDKSRSNHITPILALPLPYPNVQKSIKEMREWLLGYAQSQQILTLDFATVLMDQENKYLPGLSKDGKYPTEKGYQVMAEYAIRVLK